MNRGVLFPPRPNAFISIKIDLFLYPEAPILFQYCCCLEIVPAFSDPPRSRPDCAEPSPAEKRRVPVTCFFLSTLRFTDSFPPSRCSQPRRSEYASKAAESPAFGLFPSALFTRAPRDRISRQILPPAWDSLRVG